MNKKMMPLWLLVIMTLPIILFACSGEDPDDGTSTPPPTIIPSTPDPVSVSVAPEPITDYISNPGMGWQKDFSEYSDAFSETVDYGERLEITWKVLNPKEGEYDWSALDDQLSLADSEGKQFSFRVFTMAGEIYGGHQVPDWVLEKGAVILSSGEPDYSNCVYQEEWGRFVNELLQRYDGNPNIAFIDISGYGDFNEWSWSDFQTEWDSYWEESYDRGEADSSTMDTLDGQARRRLADMFIGGQYPSHQCLAAGGDVEEVSYSYQGFQKTQLVMPYAGTIQSTQYVHLRRGDVGFRHDCLGRSNDLPLDIIEQIWAQAPVVFEFCGPDDFNVDIAREGIQLAHPILIHNNDYSNSLDDLKKIMAPVGYRLFLKKASADYAFAPGEELKIAMIWQNLGTSPVYPRMGQDFILHIYLLNKPDNQIAVDYTTAVDVSQWLPADTLNAAPSPEYSVDLSLIIPDSLPEGVYSLTGLLVDNRTGLPVQLAMEGKYIAGQFYFFDIKIR